MEVMFLVQIYFKSTLKEDFFTFKEYKQLLGLPRNSRRLRGANLNFDFQSESYLFILAIMHFCDATSLYNGQLKSCRTRISF